MSYRTASKAILQHRGRNRTRRPKTFKSTDAAKAYAEKAGIKDYELQNLKFDSSPVKKIRIMVKK